MRDFFALVNKPLAISSNKVSIIFKKHFFNQMKDLNDCLNNCADISWKKYKFGHSGTLDPAASGLLVLAAGRATKLLPYLPEIKKYEFEILLGKKSETGDLEGNIIEFDENFDLEKLNLLDIESVLQKFQGNISQIPTKYSAIKIAGKRAYDLARKNIEFQMPERNVQIFDLNIVSVDCKANLINFEVFSSSGLYVRTLAEDIAKALGTCGMVVKLHRTSSNGFDLNDLERNLSIDDKNFAYKTLSLNNMSKFYEKMSFNQDQLEKLYQGQQLFFANLEQAFGIFCAFDDNNDFRGLVKVEKHEDGAVIFGLCMVKK